MSDKCNTDSVYYCGGIGWLISCIKIIDDYNFNEEDMWEIFTEAFRNGRLEVVKFLHETFPTECKIETIICVGKEDSLFDYICNEAGSNQVELSERCYELLHWVIKQTENLDIEYGYNKNLREYCLCKLVCFIETSGEPFSSLNACSFTKAIFLYQCRAYEVL